VKVVPSAKILVAIPEKKGSRKSKTYLGLVNSGFSGLLVSKEFMESTDFNIKLSKKATKWDTATILPQFTCKRYITTSFHMF